MTGPRLLTATVAAVAVACTAASALAFAGELTWLSELASPWRPHLGVALAACAALLIRRSLPVAGALAALAALDASAAAVRLGPRDARVDGAALTVLTLNVQRTNPRHDLVLDWLATADADVLALVEVDQAWERSLGVLEGWPHRVVHPEGGVFGLGVLARWPVRERGMVRHADTAAATLWVEVDAPGGPVDVLVAHAWPPTSRRSVAWRDEHLGDLARLVGELDGTVVLAGDLNATPWSGALRALLGATGLKDSGAGFGLQPTWPHRLAPLGIPIDHVLVSPDLAVVGREVGPFVGSDHRGVVVRLLR